jgi:hypothetical protein
VLNVLVACEFSGVVRDAFRARGHNAWSCDLESSEITTGLGHIYHLQGDVLRVLGGNIPRDMVANSNWRGTPLLINWDLMIAHPPCTYLCNSGVRWLVNDPWRERAKKMDQASQFFKSLLGSNIPRVAVENPIPHRYALLPKYTQIVQPWQFGHGETKATCLWLKGLPKLEPTKIVEGRKPRVHYASPGPDRWKERSRTLQGLADAMADQWGRL